MSLHMTKVNVTYLIAVGATQFSLRRNYYVGVDLYILKDISMVGAVGR